MIPFRGVFFEDQEEQSPPIPRGGSGVSRIWRGLLQDEETEQKAGAIVPRPPATPRPQTGVGGGDGGRVIGVRIIEAKKRRSLRLEPALAVALSTESDLF